MISSSSSSSTVDPKTSHDLDRDHRESSHHQDQNDENALEPAAKDLEEAVTAYLRRATETFDLSKNVEVSSRQGGYEIIEFPALLLCCRFEKIFTFM